ncbi:MAG: helicase RepA family protein [Deltaproteobacteria bacterium]|nr:helicase RepA family protein [Deltaproteobacteria bacterium]
MENNNIETLIKEINDQLFELHTSAITVDSIKSDYKNQKQNIIEKINVLKKQGYDSEQIQNIFNQFDTSNKTNYAKYFFNKNRIIPAAEFIQLDLGVKSWLVQDLIPSNILIFLFGIAGHYKTWFVLHLAACLANGRTFLNRQTKSIKILIVNKDSTPSELQRRLKKFGMMVNNIFVDMSPLSLDAYVTIAKEYDLIIFDSLIRFHNADENSATEMAEVMGILQKIRDAGTTVLVIHHRGKATGQGYRGSSEILAGCDLAFSLNKNPDALILKTEKTRLTPEYILHLKMTEENDVINFVELPTVPKSVTLAEKLYAFIEDKKYDGATAADISSNFGKQYGEIQPVLKEMINDDSVYLTTEGKRKVYRGSNFKPASGADQRELTTLLPPIDNKNGSNLARNNMEGEV